MRHEQGVTLIELILTILLLGVTASMLSVVLQTGFRAFFTLSNMTQELTPIEHINLVFERRLEAADELHLEHTSQGQTLTLRSPRHTYDYLCETNQWRVNDTTLLSSGCEWGMERHEHGITITLKVDTEHAGKVHRVFYKRGSHEKS